MINEFVLGVAVILLTGLLFGFVAKKCKIPNVTGYLLGGLIIGPVLVTMIIPSFSGVIGWKVVDMLSLIIDIELGFIAFTVGSEFKISYFKQVGAMPVIIAFAESLAAVLFITGGIMLVGIFLGVPLYFALCLGAVGGATAPAATIMVLRQYKAKGELSQTLLSVVAIDDASALIFFGVVVAIVKSILPGGDTSNIAMTIAMPFVEIISSVALGLATGFLLTVLIKIINTNGNRLIAVIAILFVNIGICIALNNKFNTSFSSLLACMAMGAVFTNSCKKVEEIMPLVENVTPPLVVIFFIISGAGLELKALSWTGIVLLITYLVFRVGGKIFGTWISAKACNASPKVKKWLGFGLLPQGGIAIGLSMLIMNMLDAADQSLKGAGNADGLGVFNGQLIRVIVLCAVFISEIFGPILCKMAVIKSGEAAPDAKGKENPPVAPESPVAAE